MDTNKYTFKCRVLGRGGHGAMPDKTVDPVVAAAQVICALEEAAGALGAELQWRRAEGGTRFNIIPENVLLEGVLTAEVKTAPECVRQLELAARQAAAALRAGCEMDFLLGGM